MSKFELSKNIDKEKIFLLSSSKIEKRLDVEYYLPKHYRLLKRLSTSRFPLLKLRKLSSRIVDGPFGSSVKSEDYVENGIPFVRVADVTNGEGTLDPLNMIFISEKKHSEIIRSVIHPGDLVIAKTGATMGAASIVPDSIEEGNIRGDLAAVSFPNNFELSKYVANYINTNIGYNLFWRLNSGSTRGRVVISNLKEYPVIFPNNDVIKKINKCLAEGRKKKKEKENKALNILCSIDKYMLSELGVILPIKDNSLQNRMFNSNLREITGGRFDPKLYDNNTKALRKAIAENKFSSFALKNLVIQSAAGDWGKDENEELGDKYKRCLVIRATEFDNLYNLKLENSRVKYRLIRKDKLEKIDIQENDLLIEKSGGSPDQPVGRIALITKEILEENEICYSNFIHKIRIDASKVYPEYLFCFLKTIHNIKLTDAMQSQTNGIRNLIMSNYLNQNIVIPTNEKGEIDMDKQIEISNHIRDLRKQAEQLQKDAQNDLERAKLEVEQMILGG